MRRTSGDGSSKLRHTMRLALGIAGVCLTLGCPVAIADGLLDVSLSQVEADEESGGPGYPFEIGTAEITNQEFATFLNDALDHLDDERGQYLFHDTLSGDVYVNDDAPGVVGTSGPGSLTVLIYSASANDDRITYDAEGYVAAGGFANHPVTGVSWYGALKFCNWLTLDQGMGPGQRCYGEGPDSDLDQWRPVTIAATEWLSRDLDDAERLELVENYAGYRLPMDHESTDESLYNEWYKAGAWDPAGSVHRVYGFGRDTVTSADANYWLSGDPFDNHTTPAGFFGVDGDRAWDDAVFGWGFEPPAAFSVQDTGNAYGLYDISGNVWEWVQDRGGEHSRRGIRGGSWQNGSAAMACTTRGTPTASSALPTVGFRVVRSAPGVALGALLVTPDAGLTASGPYGGPYDVSTVEYKITNIGPESVTARAETDLPGRAGPYAEFAGCLAGPELGFTDPECFAHDHDGDGDVDLADFAARQAILGAAWVTLDGLAGPIEQSLASSGQITVTAAIDLACAAPVQVGPNSATITITNTDDELTLDHQVALTVTEPLALAPDDVLGAIGPAGGPFDPESVVYTLSSESAAPINWEVSCSEDWVSVSHVSGGGGPVAGEPVRGAVDPQSQTDIVIGLAAEAELLAAGYYTSEVTFTDLCTGETFTRTVALDAGTLTVTPDDAVEFEPVAGGPFTPSSFEFTIESLSQAAMNWEVVAEPDAGWLLINGETSADGSLGALGTADITIEPGPEAANLAPGEHTTTLLFRNVTNPDNVYDVQRSITLISPSLEVTPADDAAFSGSFGGPYEPVSKTYTLTRAGSDPSLDWQVTYTTTPAGGDWLSLNGEESAWGFIFAPDETADVVVEPSESAQMLPRGRYSAELKFEDLASGAAVYRSVELDIEYAFTLPMVVVEGSNEPGGPIHDFRIGRYEVSNAEFATFLNDAAQNLDSERGQYLYHDTDSGDVYLHSEQAGDLGTNGQGTLLFDASVGGAITYDDADGEYEVATSREGHPAVGVTWYGAAKFCNWLTLIQRMDPGQRAYTEGPEPENWHPATITEADWAVRDLDAAERQDLVENYAGFRLPMDDEQPTTSAYNEWYQAAAWLPETGTHAVYGFGRDVLHEADANYLDSEDPSELDDPPLTPVGFFNGVNLLDDDETTTTDTGNGYGLYDLCGNAAEWVQDHGTSAGTRGTRGGSAYIGAVGSHLRNDDRQSVAATDAGPSVGFRVLQSLVPVTTLQITPPDDFLARGPVGGPLTPASEKTYTLQAAGPASIAHEWSVTTDADWLEVDSASSASGVAPPDGAVQVTVSLNETALSLTEPSAPFVSMALVPGDDAQPSGPDYDYRIGTQEISNFLFAAFLNDSLANTDNERGQYMYHDVDSGDVYIHSAQQGDAGTDGLGTLLFSAGLGGAISYDSAEDDYDVLAELAGHPVVGVTWYGAAKYCNWLSLYEGMAPGLLSYTEGTDDADWGLVTAIPEALLEDYCGYRLPMDAGIGPAAAYNEWYKAAAWNQTAATNHEYGFGRDTLSGADANYLASGDPDDEGTTPAGFFDGANLLADDETSTSDTDNAYGLYDMTGNVAEWAENHAATGQDRSLRGGSFNDDEASSLLTNSGFETADRGGAWDDVGFRIAQSTRGHSATITFTDLTTGTVTTRSVLLVLTEPLDFTPSTGLELAQSFRGPYPPDTQQYTITNNSETTVSYTLSVDATWVNLDVNTDGLEPGELGFGEQLTAEVSLDETAEALPPGEYDATVTLWNATSSKSQTRTVKLTVGDAVLVTPETEFEPLGLWGGPFEDYGLEQAYTLELAADLAISLDYTVTTDVDWLTFSGDPTSGTLDPQPDHVSVTATVNSNADALEVGTHGATITFAVDDSGVGAEVTRSVTLTVEDVLAVTPPDDITATYEPPADPSGIGGQTYALTNHGDVPIGWVATTDQTWVEINGASEASGFLTASGSTDVAVGFDAQEVSLLTEGEYLATVSIANQHTGQVHERSVTLSVNESLGVSPYTGWNVFGVTGQPDTISPVDRVFELTNRTEGQLSWEVTLADPGDTWVVIDAVGQAGGTLEPDGEIGATAEVTVSIDTVTASALGQGEHTAIVQFTAVGVATIERVVTLTLTSPFEEKVIPATDTQPGGPGYAYAIGTFEVTNADFADFLNDAYQNPGNGRGHYMYHDTDSGDVYVNLVQTGGAGTSGSETLTTRMFSAAVNSERITFDTDAYVVAAGFEDHPVSGVSWYGAVKYCNWLTIEQGIGLAERCYHEGPADELDDWRPVTIDKPAWQSRDLDDTERQALVAGYRGFRLPMDDGSGNPQPWSDAADDYNEWYKAAAWDQTASANRVFGFGRDLVTDADANYWESGDPFEGDFSAPRTTPAGFYDGVNLLADGTTSTVDTENSYGLYDLSGNLAEWVQDRYSGTNTRALRGGSWSNVELQGVWIRTIDRDYASPSLTYQAIGFRVLRVTE